ncbi:terminase [Aeromonas veronii]|uniref:Terminase n=1 Tax=Aeromonas veronii TaxID=654 RepID=A0A3A9IH30_AERVE|nr:terminase [Aeromonas veronii]RKJ90165.1 terminase [Aeromonas veronii]RKJ92291.1 terminase [Aeromonas veronii]
MAYTDEIRQAARRLYLRRWSAQEIKDELELGSVRVVYLWAEKYGWTELLSDEALEDAITRRYQALAGKGKKNHADLAEMDRLIGHHVTLKEQAVKLAEREQTLKAKRREEAHDAGDDAPSGRERQEGGKRKKGGKKSKNWVNDLGPEDFEGWLASLYPHQLYVRDIKNNPEMPRTRNILKSRQVGMTYYFAGEALEDAVLNGGNQIFLSATRAQSEIFRLYIIKLARTFLGVELSGNPMVLSNGATLVFCSTSANSAQGYTGNFYADEYFWIKNFKAVMDVATGMGSQSHWRKTFFSTPSSKAHGGYRLWSGDDWKGKDAKRLAMEFPTAAELRDGGRVCPDRAWRYIITLEDAVAQGFDLINMELLREETSIEVFDHLYMCEFVDEEGAVFKFQHMERASIDASKWNDYSKELREPFGKREVWLGYDPSRTRDNATLVVVAPPLFPGEKFRVLEKHFWRGMNFRYQADEIEKIAKKFRVTYLGVDVSGVGSGVYDLLQPVFKSTITPINYSVESKARLVLKMVDVVESDRIEWDQEDIEIPLAFMSIKRSTTGQGQMTFRASRSSETGHADVFFAIAHAIDNEPLDTSRRRKSTWVTSKRGKHESQTAFTAARCRAASSQHRHGCQPQSRHLLGAGASRSCRLDDRLHRRVLQPVGRVLHAAHRPAWVSQGRPYQCAPRRYLDGSAQHDLRALYQQPGRTPGGDHRLHA